MAGGVEANTAFHTGVDRLRLDDVVGEIAWPDGMEDFAPSPYERLQSAGAETVVFDAIQPGELEVGSLTAQPPRHRKIIRGDEFLLGREAEVVIVAEHLLPAEGGLVDHKNRLVNLHGEGGIGKTRLAQALCDLLEDYRHFPGGIFEIDCEPVPDANQLAVTMLQAIGVASAEQIPHPAEMLAAALQEISNSKGDVLLMLDNVDPLFDADKGVETCRLLKQLFTDCPSLRILTTCRRQLQLGGYESDFLVDPLAPQIAVSLFIQSIPDQDVRNSVQSLPPESMKHVFELVAALGGHPLSIFLAAHRIVAGFEPIAQQLEQAPKSVAKFLAAPDLVGVPPRQRSLPASLNLSYELLSERAQEIFRKSSLLPGGLYRHVDTLDQLLGDDWRKWIEEAHKIGLLRYEQEDQRFWLLNPIREYAELLLNGGEGNDFNVAVANHWAEFASLQNFLLNPAQNSQAMEKLDLPEDTEEKRKRLAQFHSQACAALMSEEANILSGYRIGLAIDVAAGRRTATGLTDYLKLYDKRQTNAWIARSMVEYSDNPETRAAALNNLGSMLSDLGDREGALDAARESSEIYRKLAEAHPEAFLPNLAASLSNLGNRLSDLGDREGALDAARESSEIYRKLAEAHPEAFLPDVATSPNNLGNIPSKTGARDRALDCFREVVETGERYPALGRNPAHIVGGSIRLADFLGEENDQESLAALDRAATPLEPIHTQNRATLGDMIEVNQRRIALLERMEPSKVRNVASELEEQRNRYAEEGEPV